MLSLTPPSPQPSLQKFVWSDWKGLNELDDPTDSAMTSWDKSRDLGWDVSKPVQESVKFFAHFIVVVLLTLHPLLCGASRFSVHPEPQTRG